MSVLPRVCVIVLNYNGTADTADCVESLQNLNYPDFKILIVDNASKDKSWKEIQKKYPSVAVLENDKNLGYAGGNNAGIRWAKNNGFQDVFILNNDTVVDPQALLVLEKFSLENPKAAILGPKILSHGPRRFIHSLGTSIDWFRLRPRTSFYGRPEADGSSDPRAIEVLPGSALLLKSERLGSDGFFNEDYFLIHEDADLSFRNLRAGRLNLLVPQAVVYHKESRTLSAYPFLTGYYSIRNFLYLCRTHANLFEKAKTLAGLCFLCAKNTPVYFFGAAQKKETARGFFQGIRDFALGRKGPRVLP